MITEKDLNEAITECQGVRNPDANTCIMLAAFYTIKDKLFPTQVALEERQYSYDPPPNTIENVIEYESDTDFSQAIHGRDAWEIWQIVDDAMSAVQVLNPQLYKNIMRKIEY